MKMHRSASLQSAHVWPYSHVCEVLFGDEYGVLGVDVVRVYAACQLVEEVRGDDSGR